MRLRVAILALAVAAGVASAARAATTAGVLASVNQDNYAPRYVVVPKGTTVQFSNVDPLGVHNVVSIGRQPNGKPLFSTKLLGFGQSVVIARVDLLKVGSYPFICTLHPRMYGELWVR